MNILKKLGAVPAATNFNGFRGSMAGLDKAKRGIIQMNGSGYNKLRNKPSRLTHLPGVNGFSGLEGSVTNRMYNYTRRMSPGESALDKLL